MKKLLFVVVIVAEVVKMISVNGVRIASSPYLSTFAQKRTHKKKRINKKWLKIYGYRELADPHMYFIPESNSYVCHPKILEIIKSKYWIEEDNNEDSL